MNFEDQELIEKAFIKVKEIITQNVTADYCNSYNEKNEDNQHEILSAVEEILKLKNSEKDASLFIRSILESPNDVRKIVIQEWPYYNFITLDNSFPSEMPYIDVPSLQYELEADLRNRPPKNGHFFINGNWALRLLTIEYFNIDYGYESVSLFECQEDSPN